MVPKVYSASEVFTIIGKTWTICQWTSCVNEGVQTVDPFEKILSIILDAADCTWGRRKVDHSTAAIARAMQPWLDELWTALELTDRIRLAGDPMPVGVQTPLELVKGFKSFHPKE